MPPSSKTLLTAVKDYLADLNRIHFSGGSTPELSGHYPLRNLLNAIGGTLRPKVFCVGELADQGAGRPDFGLYTTRQPRGRSARGGQLPERGVVEVKPITDDAWLTAESEQVSRYWSLYRLVLVTNLSDFVLIGEDSRGWPTKLEAFRMSATHEEFESKLQSPRSFADKVGVALGEYLCRALSHSAALVEPGDLARLMASYARDGLVRVERAGDSQSLHVIQTALEDALGVRFEGDRGEEFFRSTLVQTLFYGIFSAWVLWARQNPRPESSYNWREAVWHLRIPVIQALYQQLSNPGSLQRLELVEVLDWTAAALDRVDRSAFFALFNEGEAVPYFYEPFLAAFDPELRKRLGVWYTPTEIVRYMVARVDRALKDDLDIADGLAAPNVYVLDPCCGTGAYLAEVLNRIAENLDSRGMGALTGESVKEAAVTRVFGFEIMPAPLIVAHLQIGLTMQDLGSSLAEDATERIGIFLTNALTGWEQTEQASRQLPFPELDDERERAERVKRDEPILVILGNPPYNGFAGVADGEEERALSDAYRSTIQVQPPTGQGLNDLYVRFFRIAERRIIKSTKGIVCYISNYSWLDGLSFTGMRERYLKEFDVIRIDNLHGDRIISEYSPDGRPSETIFSIHGQSPGIKVGTSIALLSKISDPFNIGQTRVLYRDLHQAKAEERRRALLNSLEESSLDSGYTQLEPRLDLGLPLKPLTVSTEWFDWPALPDLFPTYFSGVKTARDKFLVDIDRESLEARIAEYFNASIDDEEIASRYPPVMKRVYGFDPRSTRQTLLNRGGPVEGGFVRYSYRPFDDRWLYWEPETKLLDAKRSEYRTHVCEKNLWLSSSKRTRKDETEPQTTFTRYIASYHLLERVSNWFPAWIHDDGLGIDGEGNHRPNLSDVAYNYLYNLGMDVDDLFHHVLAVLHDPEYRENNGGGLRMGWPRIPLPGWPHGLGSGSRDRLALSAERGRDLAALLDTTTPVRGVTTGVIRPELTCVAVPSKTGGGNMTGDDFKLSVGWGYFGGNGVVMPAKGQAVERPFTTEELVAVGNVTDSLGNSTFDIFLNDNVYWRNIPTSVWHYRLGGYQVLKKWLSYREHKVLGRVILPEEVQHFMETARRIAAILFKTA